MFFGRLGEMKNTTIFAICLFLPVLLAAQEASTLRKNYELGVNGATLLGGLMGGATDRLTEAVFFKYKMPNFWLRASFQRQATIAEGWGDQHIIGTELVEINSGNFRSGAFGTLGVEWRKALRNRVEFTYGADFVLGRSAERWVQSEARSSDYGVKQLVNGQPLYDARFGSSNEMIRNEQTANQFGGRLSAGLKIDLHTRWFLHFQSSVGALLQSGERAYVNRYTGEALAYRYTTFLRQRLPVLNEMALYFRF